MTDDPQLCGAIAVHPEHGKLSCGREVHEDGDHQAQVDGVEELLVWSYDSEPDLPVFDINAFVKALPVGVALCPMCLGIGGVVEDPPFDPTVHICETCGGHGRVRTGSLKSNEAERDCPTCQARGWMANDPGAAPAGPARSSDLMAPAPVDHMGRTPDDADFDWTRVVRDVVPIVEAAEPAPA